MQNLEGRITFLFLTLINASVQDLGGRLPVFSVEGSAGEDFLAKVHTSANATWPHTDTEPSM